LNIAILRGRSGIEGGQAAMASAKAATVVFEAREFETCMAIVEEVFRQHR